MSFMQFPHLDALLEEVEKLKRAQKLLEDVFYAFPPYELESLLAARGSERTGHHLRDFFGLDDSE